MKLTLTEPNILKHLINQELNKLKYLKFEKHKPKTTPPPANNEHIVTLMDPKGFDILRGYGNTMIEAINDLHSNFI